MLGPSHRVKKFHRVNVYYILLHFKVNKINIINILFNYSTFLNLYIYIFTDLYLNLLKLKTTGLEFKCAVVNLVNIMRNHRVVLYFIKLYVIGIIQNYVQF